MDSKTCTSLGEEYRFILDNCYFFNKIRKTVSENQQNCRTIFGNNKRGKLIEPTTMAVLQKIYEMGKQFVKDETTILTGFEKIDNKGDLVKQSSNGFMAQIQPWLDSAKSGISDSDQPYLRFVPNTDPVEWRDGKNDVSGYHQYAICERLLGSSVQTNSFENMPVDRNPGIHLILHFIWGLVRSK